MKYLYLITHLLLTLIGENWFEDVQFSVSRFCLV